MKLTYDKEADVAYINMQYPIKNGECKSTKEIDENIIIDFNAEGKMIGVEILNASKILDKKVVQEAVPA